MVSQFFSGFNKCRKGSIILLAVFASIFLVGLTALVTDVGYLYYNQARLQTAVNAGWKAGFDRMMQVKGVNPTLTTKQQNEVRSHVLEVMKANGYNDTELASVVVTFAANNHLDVRSTQNVGLFFAKAIDFNSADVSAARANHETDIGQGIVPLAIPHGVTKDLSKNIYTCNLYDENGGFLENVEYILKLGSGGGNSSVPPGDPDLKKILVPMDSGS